MNPSIPAAHDETSKTLEHLARRLSRRPQATLEELGSPHAAHVYTAILSGDTEALRPLVEGSERLPSLLRALGNLRLIASEAALKLSLVLLEGLRASATPEQWTKALAHQVHAVQVNAGDASALFALCEQALAVSRPDPKGLRLWLLVELVAAKLRLGQEPTSVFSSHIEAIPDRMPRDSERLFRRRRQLLMEARSKLNPRDWESVLASLWVSPPASAKERAVCVQNAYEYLPGEALDAVQALDLHLDARLAAQVQPEARERPSRTRLQPQQMSQAFASLGERLRAGAFPQNTGTLELAEKWVAEALSDDHAAIELFAFVHRHGLLRSSLLALLQLVSEQPSVHRLLRDFIATSVDILHTHSAQLSLCLDAWESELGGTGQVPTGQELGGTGQVPNGQELGGTGQVPNGQELGGTGQVPNGQKLTEFVQHCETLRDNLHAELAREAVASEEGAS
ncbi:MAG: hypothetical protein RBU37_21545 [Myxococcota bacterium]|jgi:hypothetical protein|nr:hypothetical protein [Myxococcota bacterium]